jgi:hypothetical protein
MRRLAAAGVMLVAATGCWLDREPEGDFTLEQVRSQPGPAPYFVGEEFEGLPLTAIVGKTPMTFIYGDCDPGGDDGGCAPPLEVQVWPIERRPPGIISDMIECRKASVRGAPGAFYGSDLDLYVGGHTVVIFADSRARTLRAAGALRPVDAKSATTGDLPAPTLDAEAGIARCADA